MAVKPKKELKTRLKMNLLFFGMSLVMLVIMGVSMYKDTHPEWMSYQEKFAAVERKVLQDQKAELLRQINHPDYIGDYVKQRKRYLDAKSAFDTASSTLDGTEANLEELELQLKSTEPDEEGGSPTADQPGASSGGPPNPVPAKATKDEMAELDKEAGGAGTAPTPSKAPPAKSDQPNKDEMAELDKAAGTSAQAPKTQEAPKTEASKGAQPSKDEMAELDKEAAKTGEPAKTQEAPKTGAAKGGQPSTDEMAELDKEAAKASAAPKGAEAKQAPAAEAAKTEETLTFEEADMKVDLDAADAKLEAAHRDMLTARRLHTKEMIGLPQSDELKRKLADEQLDEAKQTLALAEANVELEKRKADVKEAAQVAKWAKDAEALKKLPGGANADALKASAKSLQEHVDKLKRDLALVQGNLDRNSGIGTEVQQIYVERIGAIDRCTTCHMATEAKGFDATQEPFKTHPGKMLQWHPVEKFGCVSCHGGFGSALDKSEAHGNLVGKGMPLRARDQVQASCGKCHGDEKQLSGESTYLAGAQLFRDSGCLGCHKVESIGPVNKAGPGLDKVDEKVNPSWLIKWLKNPQSHSLTARMPSFGLTEVQARQISTYLLTQRDAEHLAAAEAIPDVPPQQAAEGKRLVKSLGCLGCHTILGEGATVGPELTNIRYKATPKWLYAWLKNPKAYLANSRMPTFGLSDAETKVIGDYLLSIGKSNPPPTETPPNLADKEAALAGRNLIAERGCAGCHDIKGFDKMAAPELTHVGDKTADIMEFGNANKVEHTLYGWTVAKLMDPKVYDTDKFKARMPKFGLAEDDAKAIAIYLESLTSQELPQEYTKDAREADTPLVAGRRIFLQHDCSACHRISGVGGKIGPELTREGEKVRPDWLFPFLKRPERIRWWQPSRMPNFALTDTEATNLVEYLMILSNQPAPYEYTPPDKLVFPLAKIGEKHFIDLKCQSCHPLAGKQSVVGGDTKKLGPDLGMAPKRLKRDWMLRFFRDPQAIDPGTQMPTFKESDLTFQSIIDFLVRPRSP